MFVVTKQTITDTVSATGAIKAAQSVDLAFVGSGQISSIKVGIGDQVTAGQVLLEQNNNTLYASLEGAQANLSGEEASLNQLKIGTRPDQLALDESAVSAASTTFEQSENSVQSGIQSSYVASDDAIHNQVDQFMNNPRTSNPTLEIVVTDSSLQNQIQSGRTVVEGILSNWQSNLSTYQSDSGSSLDSDVVTVESNLSAITDFLQKVSEAVNNITPSNNPNLSPATISQYKLSITTARSNVAGALSSLIGSVTGEKGAESALTSAQESLTLAQNGATADQIATEESKVQADQAVVDGYNAQIENTIMRAPIDGVITRQDASVGEIATPGVTLVSLNSTAKFQMDLYLSENDIANVKVGQPAMVTLDALASSTPLSATVLSVSPGAQMENGMLSYQTTLQINSDDPSVKAGMSASANISVGSSTDALVIPQSAVITQGSGTFVLKYTNGSNPQLVPVTLGLKDVSGVIQAISGLSEGDSVATFGLNTSGN